MFHVKHIFYFRILYNIMFHADILVGYLINNIFVLFHVKHCNCRYIIFNNTYLFLIVGNDVSRETLLIKWYFILINNLNKLKLILKSNVSRETLLIKCYFILMNSLNKLKLILKRYVSRETLLIVCLYIYYWKVYCFT